MVTHVRLILVMLHLDVLTLCCPVMTAMPAPLTLVIPKLDVVTPLLTVTITTLVLMIGVLPTLGVNIPP
jgi:hypothetical protein